jgi:peroxiredoxin/Tfp pilus assembly protein PilF
MKLELSMIALLLALASAPARADELRNVKVGQAVPPFAVRALSGGELRSAALRGKVVVLVYVSAEQTSSEAALEEAVTVGRELRHPDLEVVAMTADAARVDFFRAQRDRLGIHHEFGLDVGREVYGALGLIVVPTTIVIDREGRLAHVISSHKSDYEHVLRSYIRHALGLIDEAGLASELATAGAERNPPRERIARHRAAARLLREGGLLADAEKELAAALEIDRDDGETQLDLASLRMAPGRLDEAETLVASVTAAGGHHRRVQLLTGILLYHRDQLEKARSALEQALLLNPDPVLTHYYLGLIDERLGNDKAAIEHFKESLSRLLANRPA